MTEREAPLTATRILADAAAKREQQIERAMQSAEAYLRTCSCATCLTRRNDVLHYFNEHRCAPLYRSSAFAPTALTVDAHIYAECLTLNADTNGERPHGND